MLVIKDEGSRPIKAWVGTKELWRPATLTLLSKDITQTVPDIEDSAMQQLKNLATLPFIAGNGVAVMPDVHAGIGSTVGTVIATHKAILPAAVGVDIGCFTADTLVFLADGKDHRIGDLAERVEQFTVYSCTARGDVTAALATARKTRAAAALVAVTLDNGERIRCTPDHEFQLRDGSYCKAENLQLAASLMPLYKELDPEGYLRVKQNRTGYWQRAHWVIARSGVMGAVPKFEGQKTIIHHNDFTQDNNDPGNLQFMGSSDHSAYHRGLVDRNEHWQSPEFELNRKKALRALANTPEGRAMMAVRGTANITKHMTENREAWLKSVAGNGARGAPTLTKYNTSDTGRAKSSENAKALQKVPRECPECDVEVLGHLALLAHRRRDHGLRYNHTVVSVERLSEIEDVYCLTVPSTNNFALSAGVFVHNCGMNAVRLSLKASDLPDNLKAIFDQISRDIPVGNARHKEEQLMPHAEKIKLSKILSGMGEHTERSLQMAFKSVGTLGSGNHFIELCLDENQDVWIMLHSGSRGIGNLIGRHFIEVGKRVMEKYFITLPDADLAYLAEGTPEFDDYVEAVAWAQNYALENRKAMMGLVLSALERHIAQPFCVTQEAINCHHNYVEKENHFGQNLWVTRKGAIRARAGDLGIIPGSMGQRSFIVRGKGNPESYCSCSHGAGRAMSRTQARKVFTVADLAEQTEGVMCRKDDAVLDEIPSSYKDIDVVMANQLDLVDIVHTLKAILCVKGG